MTSLPGTAAGPAGFSVSVDDVAATAAVFARTHATAADAAGTASGALSGSAGMGGDDPVLARWRARYDAVARAAWSAGGAAVVALHDIAVRLVETGDAYLAADHASTPNRSGAARALPPALPPVGPATPVAAGPPPSTGPVGDAVPAGLAEYWPGGEPVVLRRAAAAWSGLADALDDAALAADAAFRGLLAHNRGEGFSAMATFWASRYVLCGTDPLFNVAPDGARTLGQVCVGLADLIEATRRTMERAAADAARNTDSLELLGLIPGPPGRVGAFLAQFAGPVQQDGFVQVARRDYLAQLDELTARLSPDLEARLDRAARFPTARDAPGLTVTDVGEVVGLGLRGSGWDQITGDRPTPDSVHITPERRTHVLDGDGPNKGGGHRAGTGKPGKTEFPAAWSDDHIMESVLGVARDPDPALGWKLQDNGRWKVHGVRDGVLIEAIVGRDGYLWTAYPVTGPGVLKNPKN